ncbi:MAG TPA: cohesin domain-containing protein [Candidatus Dormibacteraeota bacterium]|nr:cohesin domain-containing protein [Candidatus Dormibacteraeota bacterium]
MSVLPAPLLSVHAQSASVFINPSVNAGDLGGMFTVQVMGSDISSMLVGYDIVLTYDNTVLSFVSGTFNAAPDVFAGMNPFVVNSGCSDATGQCQSTQSLIGGSTADCSSSCQFFDVTFQVISANSAVFTLPKADIAAAVGGSISLIPVTTAGATFLVPPTLTMVSPYATLLKTAFHLSKGTHDTQAVISTSLVYSSSNVRAGFGGVIYDVIAPDGTDTAVQSNLAFFLTPGTSGSVSGTYMFSSAGNQLGRYTIIVTLLRCADENSCVKGTTVSSPTFFFVKA